MINWEIDYWGSNVERLRDVKAKYDPDNVFSFQQSIPPAGAPSSEGLAVNSQYVGRNRLMGG